MKKSAKPADYHLNGEKKMGKMLAKCAVLLQKMSIKPQQKLIEFD